MTIGEKWQIAIGIISIFSSILLSLIIFYYQIKIEKKTKRQDVENKLTNFIIENKDEINLLPLCVISNSIHKTDKHSHRIYTSYNKLDKEVQKAILEHEEIKFNLKISNEIIDKVISSFKETEKQYAMGNSMLYEGAKYLHRAYESYKNEIISDIDPFVFKNPCPTFLEVKNTNFHTYVDNYLLHEINPNDDALIKIQKKYFNPPMDLLFDCFNLGSCDEKIVCFWLMRYIVSSCYVLCNRKLVEKIDDEKMPIMEEFNIHTYEDMYYYTIYMLVKTFLKTI